MPYPLQCFKFPRSPQFLELKPTFLSSPLSPPPTFPFSSVRLGQSACSFEGELLNCLSRSRKSKLQIQLLLLLVCLYDEISPCQSKIPLAMLFGNMLPNPPQRHLFELQTLDSGLLSTSYCSNINLLVKKLVPPCIDSPNTLCCRNFLLHRDLLTLCIKELRQLPMLSVLEYPEGLIILLQSLPPFAEAFYTPLVSIPPPLHRVTIPKNSRFFVVCRIEFLLHKTEFRIELASSIKLPIPIKGLRTIKGKGVCLGTFCNQLMTASFPCHSVGGLLERAKKYCDPQNQSKVALLVFAHSLKSSSVFFFEFTVSFNSVNSKGICMKKCYLSSPTQSGFVTDNNPAFVQIKHLRTLDSGLTIFFPNLCLVYASKTFSQHIFAQIYLVSIYFF